MLTDVYRADTYFGNRYVHAMLLSIRASGWELNNVLSYL